MRTLCSLGMGDDEMRSPYSPPPFHRQTNTHAERSPSSHSARRLWRSYDPTSEHHAVKRAEDAQRGKAWERGGEGGRRPAARRGGSLSAPKAAEPRAGLSCAGRSEVQQQTRLHAPALQPLSCSLANPTQASGLAAAPSNPTPKTSAASAPAAAEAPAASATTHQAQPVAVPTSSPRHCSHSAAHWGVEFDG